MKRVCTEPGCVVLVDVGTSRCPDHARELERRRGSSTERGYGKNHRRLRARWQRRLDRGEVIVCWRPGCDTVIDPANWHLGHDDDDRSRYRGPECVPCNTATAGRR